MILIKIFVVLIASFQIFYLYKSIIGKKRIKSNLDPKIKPITIIIPVFNSERTISKCLESILLNNKFLISKTIVVFDHCTDESENIVKQFQDKFTNKGIKLSCFYLNRNKTGKVEGILKGFKHTKTEQTLLVDSDIILNKKAVENLIHFHFKNKCLYSSCYIYPYTSTKNTILEDVINNDRLYRQNILQNVRNNYGLSNFPGSIGIVNTSEYKEKLKSGFLEDLTATFAIIKSKKEINILKEPLAFEIERKSIRGVLLQRTRWTIGNIENIKNLIQTISSTKRLLNKFIITSYPIMWYIQHYFIVLGWILFCINEFKVSNLALLTPQLLYLLQICLSACIGKKYYKNSVFGVLIHSIIYPLIISISLVAAILTLIKKRKMFFKSKLLFVRI